MSDRLPPEIEVALRKAGADLVAYVTSPAFQVPFNCFIEASMAFNRQVSELMQEAVRQAYAGKPSVSAARRVCPKPGKAE